jgi:hypothetical protein
MKKILLLSSFFAFLFSDSLISQDILQRKCGTMEYLAAQQKNDPSLALRMQEIEAHTRKILANPNHPTLQAAGVVTIPVVFHVVYATAAQNISDAKCMAQLNQLNLDYARLNADASKTPGAFTGVAADTKIQFCLAQRDANGLATTGIIHKSTTTASFIDDDKVKSSTTGGDNAWPAGSYLNIWACNLGSGLLGYAQFPGGAAATDGVVLLYSSIGSVALPGTATSYNLGRTATHEVGHWLNLRHIWGDANCGNDLVDDTPTQQTSNFSCPTFPHVTCSNGPNGDMFMNYMDYTDDACMNIFTAGQANRMNALFAAGGSRAAIATSLGCQPPSTTCGLPTGLTATAITATSATLGWTAVSGAASYNIQYRIVGATTWTATTSTTNSKSVSGLTASSNYEFQVQTVCANGNSAFTTSGTFTTSAVTVTCSLASGLTASAITSSAANLAWTAVTGANSYNVQYRIVGVAAWIAATSTTNLKAISGLTASSNYEFQVQTVCANGSSAFTASASFATSPVSGSCTDNYESNDTSANAATVATNTNVTGIISSVSDVDWFKFSTAAPNTNIKVNLSSLPADYDITLYNAALAQLGSSASTGTTAEQIIYNTTTASAYYVKVNGFNNGTQAGYNFTAGTASASSIGSKVTVSAISQGNNNGTTTLITNSSASSGYTGASGTYNAGAAARTGVLNTAASGSAYFEFTVTPAAGNAFILTGISFGARSTSTGPQAYTLRSSLDGYATSIATGTIANTSAWALKSNNSLAVSSAAGAAITFRLYGYNGTGSASAGTANWRVDDITLTGSANAFNATQCYTLNIGTGSTGFRVAQPENINTLLLYPNPASDHVNLEYSTHTDTKTRIQVADLTGRILVNRVQYSLAGINKLSLNTSGLAKGVYILKITLDENTATRKFIVK